VYPLQLHLFTPVLDIQHMRRAFTSLRSPQQTSSAGYQLLDMAIGHDAAAPANGVGMHDQVVDTKALDGYDGVREASSSNEVVGAGDPAVMTEAIHELEATNVHWYSYFTTIDFWVVVALGQVLALCTTATNTLTTFIINNGATIPAFQTLFNYILLALIYATFTLVRYGPRKLGGIILRDGWKYFILSFLDVQGNYFTVLAYDYTNILSAQLLNFWSIVCVVIISFCFLHVRYRPFQILGILVCCGGMGLLLASDHITGSNGGPGVNMLKGDLFGLLGASCYGLSNVFEEWFVSKRPMYEVLCFLGVFGMCINGVQAAIFDRDSIQNIVWTGPLCGYIVGYTLALTLFYSLAPLILRMGSAAFFDISLLTTNFWGTIIGIQVFGYTVYYLYPIAFVLIIVGLVVYFLAGSVLGDSKKPWLGEGQEGGVAGIGTAKLKAINRARAQGLDAGTHVA
jgi:solute carrier family 35, member F1/2